MSIDEARKRIQTLDSFAFAERATEDMRKLTAPLKEYGIDRINFSRTYFTGEYFYFSPSLDLIRTMVSSVFSPVQTLADSARNGDFYKVWPPPGGDTVFDKLNDMGISHGVNFFKINTGEHPSIDNWSFSSSPEKTQIINFYLNNLDFLNRYVSYCSYHIDLIIKKSSVKEKFIYPDGIGELFNFTELKEKRDNLLSSLRVPIVIGDKLVMLSNQEEEVLKSLSEGYGCKEVASKLGISPRTVETYLEKIRLKTGCLSKSQAVTLYIKNHKP
jgi:DNA-binding CsgD family transcriptional regulator